MSDGLTISDLDVVRGERPVLHSVSLEVPAGHVTALLGPNGAGKSSLVLALGGLIPVARGHIEVSGVSLTNATPEKVRAGGLAVVPEGRWLLRGLTVEENLNVATYAVSRAEAARGVAYAKELFPELEKRWHSRAGLLSGGEQQMVAIAQALATRPAVLVVDELSLGLAPVVVRRLVPVLESVAAEGAAVLLIEQFAEIALAAASTASILEGGKLRFTGPSQDLLDHPELLSGAYLQANSSQ